MASLLTDLGIPPRIARARLRRLDPAASRPPARGLWRARAQTVTDRRTVPPRIAGAAPETTAYDKPIPRQQGLESEMIAVIAMGANFRRGRELARIPKSAVEAARDADQLRSVLQIGRSRTVGAWQGGRRPSGGGRPHGSQPPEPHPRLRLRHGMGGAAPDQDRRPLPGGRPLPRGDRHRGAGPRWNRDPLSPDEH